MSILIYIPEKPLQLKFVQLKSNDQYALLVGVREVPAKKGKNGYAAYNELAIINNIIDINNEGHILYDNVNWLVESDIKEMEAGVTVYIQTYETADNMKTSLLPFIAAGKKFYKLSREKLLKRLVENLKNNIQGLKENCYSDLEGLISECKSKQNTIVNRNSIPSSFSTSNSVGLFNDLMGELKVKQELFEELNYIVNDPLFNLGE